MLFKRNRALHHIFLEPKNSSFSPWLPTGDILEIGQFLKQVTPSCEENNQKQERTTLKKKDSRMCPALSQLLIETYKQNVPVTSICVLFRHPHGGGDYHKNSNTALRLATLCANCDPPTFGKKGEWRGGGKNKRDSGYFFPFSWAVRGLVTAFSLSLILHHHLLGKRAPFGNLNSSGMSANQKAGSRECVIGRPVWALTL